MASYSFWTIVFIVALLYQGNSAALEEWVHLTDASVPNEWNGKCGETSICTAASPCSISTPTAFPSVTLDPSNGKCFLVFHGNWNRMVELVANHTVEEIRIVGQTVGGLNLGIHFGGTSLAVVNGTGPSSFHHSRFMIQSLGSEPEVTLANLELWNTSFHIYGQDTASIHVNNVQLSDVGGLDNAAFLEANFTQISNFSLHNLTVKNDAPLETLLNFNSTRIDNFRLTSSTLHIQQLLADGTIISGLLADSNVTIASSNGHFIKLAEGEEPDNFSIVNSNITGADATAYFANRDFPMNMSSSILKKIMFVMYSNEMLPHFTVIYKTIWIDCEVVIQNVPMRFDDSEVYLNGPQSPSYLVLKGGDSSQYLTIDANFLEISQGNLTMAKLVKFTEDSNLEIENVHITGGQTLFANVTVTKEITLRRGRFRPAITGPTWTFHPIAIKGESSGDDSVIFTGVHLLRFKTDGTGLQTTNVNVEGLPENVLITWLSNNPPSTANNPYHITSLNPTTSNNTYSRSPASSPYIFEPFVEANALQFRYIGPSQLCQLPIPEFFVCDNGVLVAPDDVSSPTVTLPAGSGSVYVNGNLTIGDSLTFGGLGTQLNVTGCVVVQNEIVIDLSKTKSLPDGDVTLISQSPNCDQSLTSIPLKTKSDDKNCKKTKVKISSTSTPSLLNVTFAFDNSSCNTKWIILGSVLGSVVLILIILILVFTFNQKARDCIRPFSRKRTVE